MNDRTTFDDQSGAAVGEGIANLSTLTLPLSRILLTSTICNPDQGEQCVLDQPSVKGGDFGNARLVPRERTFWRAI